MKDVRKDHARLLSNLVFLQRLYTAKALALCIGVNPTTWGRKMREPWRMFTYDDLRMISVYCDTPLEKLICGEVGVNR